MIIHDYACTFGTDAYPLWKPHQDIRRTDTVDCCPMRAGTGGPGTAGPGTAPGPRPGPPGGTRLSSGARNSPSRLGCRSISARAGDDARTHDALATQGSARGTQARAQPPPLAPVAAGRALLPLSRAGDASQFQASSVPIGTSRL